MTLNPDSPMSATAPAETAHNKKLAIVTGANTGLGFETTLGLAQAGYKVVLACRTAAKAESAMEKIIRQAPDADLVFLPLNLISRGSIKQFAATFVASYGKLDLLINNAGVMGPPFTITPNGLELQFDANYLGHFYLTAKLIGALDQEHETRIVNVSSLAAKREWADIYFDNLNFKGSYDSGPRVFGLTGMVAYSQSKLANVLFTMELKDRLAAAGKHIKAVVVHPGVANTDLSRNMPLYMRLLAPVLVKFMNVSTPAEGAQPTLYGATQPDVEAGDFIGPTGEGERAGPPGKVPLPPQAANKVLCEKLWARSEELLGTTFRIH